MPVDGVDNATNQRSEPLSYERQFLVERVFQQILVYIPHQMDKAFLLRTGQRVVGTVEIAHQHAFEPAQNFIELEGFTRG